MSEKPIIRHCRNCEYFGHFYSTGSGRCTVKYQYVIEETQRVKAMFCRYYKQKGKSDK